MDNVDALRIMLALLVIITILLSFLLSLIIFRINLDSMERWSKKEIEIKIKNRRNQNDR